MRFSQFLWMFAALFGFLTQHSAQARWATVEDESALQLYEDSEIQVFADGTFESVTTREIEIKKEDARAQYGSARFFYNSRAETLEVLEAWSRDANGTKRAVPAEFIQDRPLASSEQGFDQMSQITVAYSDATVGSTLFVKLRNKHREVPFQGFYSESFIYGSHGYEGRSRVRIDSEIPLFVEENDPRNVLKIQTHDKKDPKTGKTRYRLEIIQKKPELYRVIDEADSYLRGDRLTWVDVSSSKNWSDLAKPVLGRYETLSNAALPPLFEQIRKSAAKEKDVIEKLDLITSRLAEEMRYWADWRPIRGGHIPREPAVIAESRFGDCKDFALATVVILRKLGIPAHVAWVKRNSRPVFTPNSLPLSGSFNHAIVHVGPVGPEGQTFWIDPTNRTSFARGLYEDIADRPSLVLYPEGARLERIPRPGADASQVSVQAKVATDHDQTRNQVRIDFKGRSALAFSADELNRTPESINRSLLKLLTTEGRLKDWKVAPYDLSSRVVRDLSFQLSFTEEDVDLRTSAGTGWLLPAPGWVRRFLALPKDRESDFYQGLPGRFRRETLLSDSIQIGSLSLNCSLDTPWFKTSRVVQQDPDGLRIVEESEGKTAIIPNEALKSPLAKKVRQELRRCFEGAAVIYQPREPQAAH